MRTKKIEISVLLLTALLTGIVMSPAVNAAENVLKQKQINPEKQEEFSLLEKYLKEIAPDTQVPIMMLLDFGGQLNKTTFEDRSKAFVMENGLYPYVYSIQAPIVNLLIPARSLNELIKLAKGDGSPIIAVYRYQSVQLMENITSRAKSNEQTAKRDSNKSDTVSIAYTYNIDGVLTTTDNVKYHSFYTHTWETNAHASIYIDTWFYVDVTGYFLDNSGAVVDSGDDWLGYVTLDAPITSQNYGYWKFKIYAWSWWGGVTSTSYNGPITTS